MKLIDRYVYAVTERLPQDIREDVSRELQANIEDMLPENPTENDVREVLVKLGNPVKLAGEYSPTKRYLIGPGLYDSYFSVLKLVIGILVSVLPCITFLQWTLEPPIKDNITQMSVQFFVDLLVNIIQGAIQGALWVTLVFVVLEKSGINEGQIPFFKKKWSPDDLPTVPASSKGKISRVETMISVFFTVFFAVLLCFKPQLIAIYLKGDAGTQVIPLFAIESLRSYTLIIFILAVIQLSIFIWKFITMRWSIALAIANASLNALLCIFLVVILSDNSLFNHEFLSKIIEYTAKIELSQIKSIWFKSSIWIFAAVFIAISLWDSIAGFVKCKK
jgi:hypothetical protein